MRVLILNTFDMEGGAARSAYRLNKSLNRLGVPSNILVQRKIGDDPTIIGPRNPKQTAEEILRPHLDRIPLAFYPKRQKYLFSPAVVPDQLLPRISALNPDVIHLNWIAGGFMRVETLQRLKQPLVWSMRDSWPFTGGCHIPFECVKYQQSCGTCPMLGSNDPNDLSHKVWRRKKAAWEHLNLTVVSPSRWLAQCASSSSLFGSRRIEVIPNGLDLKIYKPIDKKVARQILDLPQDKKLIVFGAMSSTSDKNKGFHLLIEALKKLEEKGWGNRAELIVFGASEPLNPPKFGFKANYTGRLNDDPSLVLLYNAADVFVAPSMSENLSNTVLEALSTGTPCVAFNIGGMPDMIQHQQNGFLAVPYETDSFAEGIHWILEDDARWRVLSANARQKVEKEFDLETTVNRYLNLYRELSGKD